MRFYVAIFLAPGMLACSSLTGTGKYIANATLEKSIKESNPYKELEKAIARNTDRLNRDHDSLITIENTIKYHLAALIDANKIMDARLRHIEKDLSEIRGEIKTLVRSYKDDDGNKKHYVHFSDFDFGSPKRLRLSLESLSPGYRRKPKRERDRHHQDFLFYH